MLIIKKNIRDIMTKLFSSLYVPVAISESHDCLRRLAVEESNEAQLKITLAVHFFSKLSVSKGFKIDKYAASRTVCVCRCGNCKVDEIVQSFGDTTIGKFCRLRLYSDFPNRRCFERLSVLEGSYVKIIFCQLTKNSPPSYLKTICNPGFTGPILW